MNAPEVDTHTVDDPRPLWIVYDDVIGELQGIASTLATLAEADRKEVHMENLGDVLDFLANAVFNVRKELADAVDARGDAAKTP